MVNNPIYYNEVQDLLNRLCAKDEHVLRLILSYESEAEFRDAKHSLEKLLSAYVQISDDLKELQEV